MEVNLFAAGVNHAAREPSQTVPQLTQVVHHVMLVAEMQTPAAALGLL